MAGSVAKSTVWIAGQNAGVDRTVLLVVPGVLFVILLFIYPFLYGLGLSFTPKEGGFAANYAKFFSTPYLSQTIWTTLSLAIPATVINVGFALPLAFHLRHASRPQRIISGLLVVPITLGTVLVAEGLLTYLGPQGWFNRALIEFGLINTPVKLTHNYWGVLMSLVVTGFPFDFLLILSYITGIDPALAQAAATLGAGPIQRFRQIYLPLLAPGLAVVFCLAFVLSFSVFPSAILLGNPASSTRVITIAAYQAAYEDYDYSLASAIAMIMCAVQLVIVAVVLSIRGLFYRGPAGGAKG
ncbi:MAG: sugar ABC transporter permease [Alphaproteobacteria bacterium]|nr:sugar ABC transporter permease [Alphaproteobacteria bacterium]